MLVYAIADTNQVAKAIFMFYYEAILNNRTMTYLEAFCPWPSHKAVGKEFECQLPKQGKDKSNMVCISMFWQSVFKGW